MAPTAVSAPQALRLTALTRQQATEARFRHAHRSTLGIGPSLRLQLCEPDGAGCGPDPVRIALRWGEEDVALHCPAEIARDALPALDAELAPLAELPPDLAGLLLEAAATEFIKRWEMACGRSIAVIEAARAVTEPVDGLPMALHAGAVRCRVYLECTPPQAAAMLASWPITPRPLDLLALPAVLRIGATTLSRRVVASLRPGDAVLLQRSAEPAVLVVAESWVAQAHRRNDDWTLAEAPRPDTRHRAPNHPGGGWTMAEHDAGQNPGGLPVAEIDDIPVTLTFEIGRLGMALGQLRRLGPGSVIELGRSRQELVEIAVHGRAIGQGELVEIEGAVGVRIVRLFEHG